MSMQSLSAFSFCQLHNEDFRIQKKSQDYNHGDAKWQNGKGTRE